MEDEHQEHPTAQRNKSRDPEGAYGRNGSSPHKPGPLRKLCDELGVAGIEDEDAVLAEAQALAETERQELREHAKQQAEEWQKQRIQKDECSAPDQQSVNLVCPQGHRLCLVALRGRCLNCRKTVRQRKQSVGCTGDCRFVVCQGCAKATCGEDVMVRLHLSAQMDQG